MKSTITLLLSIFLIATTIKAQPPNNAIFMGGMADGFNAAANTSLSNTIFFGGVSDGFASQNNVAVSNNIFVGGIGDGWIKAANISASNMIFTGGIGDGWNFSANNSASNTIFIGGIGDGWNIASNASVANNIFIGGIGDGWGSQYRPMKPLPVNILFFNVRKQSKNSSLLSWKTTQELNSSHYDVERSTDAVNFSFIGKVIANSNSTTENNYSFIDNIPALGFNYYRLKQIDKNGQYLYTPARVLNFDDLDAASVKYYPNPTNGILNIELNQEMKNGEKWITISNSAGIVVDQVFIPQTNNLIIPINLNKFSKGIYFIHLKTSCCSSTQRIILQ